MAANSGRLAQSGRVLLAAASSALAVSGLATAQTSGNAPPPLVTLRPPPPVPAPPAKPTTAPPAAPVVHNSARPPRPSGRVGAWATDLDYPRDALPRQARVKVLFRLTVTAGGVPSACDITSAFADAEFDRLTCDLMMQRARFFPATDASGHPVEGVFRSAVLWSPPRN